MSASNDNFKTGLEILEDSKPHPIEEREKRKQHKGLSLSNDRIERSKQQGAAMDFRSNEGLCLKCGIYKSMGICPYCFLLMSPASEYSERLRDLNKKEGGDKSIADLHALVGW